MLFQETNLFMSRNFKVPSYSVFRADRTLTRRGPATAGNQNCGGVLTLINSDLFFQMVPVPTLTLSDPASDYLCVKINFQKQPPLFFLNVYSPPIRNTQLSSRPRTFSPKLRSNSSDNFISVISMSIIPSGTHTSLPTVLAIPYSIGSHPSI